MIANRSRMLASRETSSSEVACEPASAAQMMRIAACRIIAEMGRCTLAVVRSVKRGAAGEGRRAQIRPPRQTDDVGTG
jgi:hypothetical protein